MRILRVFPERTKYTPRDGLVEIGEPRLFTPKDVTEVHVSCTFSWQADKAMKLWAIYQNCGAYKHCKVKIGGPAIRGNYSDEFIPGRYVRKGIVYTTRGCDFRCPWCMVRDIEGGFREIPVTEGNEIQDNNILLSSRSHWDKVISMLRTQKGVRFVGGLDARLLKAYHVEDLRSLSIKELWFAYDKPSRRAALLKVAERLKAAGFKRYKLRCYVLVKYDKRETVQDAEERLRDCWRMGFLPFVQIYRPPDSASRGCVHLPAEEYKGSWQQLRWLWSRARAMHGHMKEIDSEEEQCV